MRRNFFDHLHAPRCDRRVFRPQTTFGLGMAALTCLGLLLLSGMTLLFYYVPAQGEAYERILHISTTLRFGRFLRDLHYISANALVLVVFFHLGRVYLTGSYKDRRLNWLYGLGLLALVLAANFTGYLLPWDQLSYWAVKVGANMFGKLPLVGDVLRRLLLGGNDIGHDTLVRSFALHVSVVPLSLLALTALHLWRLRKDGGIALPPTASVETVPARPWLYRAEAAVFFGVLALVALTALNIHAPIHERANPLHPPNPAKAPAYWGGVVFPAALAGLFVLIPWLDRSRSPAGQWFSHDRLGRCMLFLLLGAVLLGLIVVGQWFRGRDWQLVWPF